MMTEQALTEAGALPDRLVFVVLAGNDADPNLLGGAGQPSKFLMPFADDIVGDRILHALDQSHRCRAISVALPPRACRT